MSLSSYTIFKTVVEQNSFQRAADILNLTPSAISHSMSCLEKDLGFPLFSRNKKSIQLTGNGEFLLPYIQSVLQSEEHFKQQVSKLNGLEKGNVKLCTFNSVCTNWVPNIIATFNMLYPYITLEIFQGSYNDVSEWIKNGTADIGFLSVASAGHLPITAFYKDPLVCVVPKGMQITNKKYVTIEDLRNQKFVFQSDSNNADINLFFKKHTIKAFSACHVVDDQSTIAMVECGFGICIMPELVMKNQKHNVDIYPIEHDESRVIGISTLNDLFMAPAVKKLYKHIINLYKNIEQQNHMV